MRPTFYGLEIAKSGLNISQYSINITAHNMANVNTKGYTRQRLDQVGLAPLYGNSYLQMMIRGVAGRGADARGIEQIRDLYLDKQIRNKAPSFNYYDTKYLQLDFIQGMFDETNTSSVTNMLQNFINGWHELSKEPDNSSFRTALRESAKSLTETINDYHNKLVTEQVRQNEMLSSAVNRINQIGENIAKLNDEIYRFELTNGRANDLRDQRNLLLDELAEYVDFEYFEEPGVTTYPEDPDLDKSNYGKVTILIKDQLSEVRFVDGTKSITKNPPDDGVVDYINCEPTADLLLDMQTEALELRFSLNRTALDIRGGKVKAYLDLRDGDGIDNAVALDSDDQYGIPYIIRQLNVFAVTMVRAINEAHQMGFTLDTAPGGSKTGVDFFDDDGINAMDFAGRLRLSDEILESVGNIAASSDPVDELNTGNGIALEALIASVLNSTTLDFAGMDITSSLAGYIRTMFSTMGSQINKVQIAASTEKITFDTYTDRREAISGVNTDEEATNLVRFQRAYAASARAFTAMDEALDILINRTGMVGR